MSKQFRKRADEDELVKRYEAMLRNKERTFFDLDEFETIIDHYIEANKNKRALTAVELAVEQYPFSSEL
ncbi:MAG: hypothetical protein ACKORJ_08120, partial [Bacteroidota bacterium]